MQDTNQIYNPFLDPRSAENKVISYRERAKKLLAKEYGEYGSYLKTEITITAQMLQQEENK